MILSQKTKALILATGDLALFYISLYLALTLRYQSVVSWKIWDMHQTPFLFLHLLWLLVFFLHDLYDIKSFSSLKTMLKRIVRATITITLLTTLIFYIMPGLIIAPKTNLFIDVSLLTLLLTGWRKLFWEIIKGGSKTNVLFFGSSKEVEEIAKHLKDNPQIGYKPAVILSEVDHNLIDLIKKHKINLIVASKKMLYSENSAKIFYETLPLGINIMDFPNFYEIIMGKIPVSIINEVWFLENLSNTNKKTFELLKRLFDIIGGVLLGVPTLIITPMVAALSKIESGDKIFVRQKRVGKHGKIFTLLKFRSMYQAEETDGKPQWAKENDERITKIGEILRKTRIDELPQLWNILKGEMSFIGPRAERPEFVEQLCEQIPFYSTRHLVKPGASGWAQINFPYGASVEDAMKKLQYDLYYIKNRSVVLDLIIFLKTIFVMARREGR